MPGSPDGEYGSESRQLAAKTHQRLTDLPAQIKDLFFCFFFIVHLAEITR